MFLFSLNFYI